VYYVFVDTIDSVQLLAKKLHSKISDDIILFTAAEQTQGIGRENRQWLSNRGGLYLTAVLKNKVILNPAPLFISTALSCFLQERFGIQTNIKWPNDLLYNNKKICGILVDLISYQEQNIYFIGIGINYNNCLPKKIDDNEAISISEILRKNIDFEICSEARKIAEYIINYQEINWLDIYKKKNCLLNKKVSILLHNNEILCGYATDINNSGALIIDNKIEIISAKKIISHY